MRNFGAFFIGIIFLANLSSAQVFTLSPTDDSYIRISDSTTSSHGSETYMVTNNGTSSGKLRWSFVKFDLSSITEPIIGVKLELQDTGVGGQHGVQEHTVYGLITGENWTEGTLNYTNAPAKSGNAIDMAGVYGGQALSVFDYDTDTQPIAAVIDQATGGSAVNFINADNDGIITFIIARTEAPDDNGIAWATKESTYSGIAQPLLTVYTGVVVNPDPVNGQGLATDPESPLFSGTAVDRTLFWELVNDPNIDSGFPVEYRLYMDPNEIHVETGTDCQYFSDFSSGALYDPTVNLSYETIYYWRVDTRFKWDDHTEPNVIDGFVWEFKTVTELPSIMADPENEKIGLAESASLTVSYESISVITVVTWFKDGVEVSTDSEHAVTWDQTSSTLTITNADVSDFGSYYCVVENGGGTAMSASAILAEKKLLARYEFEQNADDSVGINHGTPVPAMAYSEGQVGSYAADPNGINYIELSTTAYPKAGFGNGLEEFTCSFWVKRNTYSGDAYILGVLNDGQNSAIQVNINGSGTLVCYIRQEGSASILLTSTSGLINTDEWHYVVLSFDGQSLRGYLDGLMTNEVVHSPLTEFADWQYPLVLCSRNSRGAIGPSFPGELDDLRIYNYVLTDKDIAQDYYDLTGVQVCIDPQAVGLADYNNDCKVDISDFVLFSESWLSSGLYPVQ